MKGVGYISAVVALVASLALLPGCFDEEFSSSPSDVLSFSVDSLRFDTVFTTMGTATQNFKVYNRNSKALMISSINLADAGKSGFYINVDGMKGPDIYNMEISAGDSLYVLVEITAPVSGQNAPLLIKDSIVFIVNGVRQDVKLEAFGQDAVPLRKVEYADGVHTLNADKPYIVYDTLSVGENAELVLSPGAQLCFHAGSKLVVEGKITARGEIVDLVVVRGDRLDNMFSYLPYDRLAGQWDGVYIKEKSYDNVFDHVVMRGTVNGLVLDSADVSRNKITITNSVLHNSSNNILTVKQCSASVQNSELSNAVGALVYMEGGTADFLQCTLANYYALFESIKLPMIYLTRFDDPELVSPAHVSFGNCIVTGNAGVVSPSDVTTLDVSFRNTLFSVAGSDDDNFINCIWGGTPMFNCVGGDIYYYDYRISSSASSAYHTGDESLLTEPLRRDMNGVERPYGTNPDVGAYQIPEPQVTPPVGGGE